jgi:hypothetical protein
MILMTWRHGLRRDWVQTRLQNGITSIAIRDRQGKSGLGLDAQQ